MYQVTIRQGDDTRRERFETHDEAEQHLLRIVRNTDSDIDVSIEECLEENARAKSHTDEPA